MEYRLYIPYKKKDWHQILYRTDIKVYGIRHIDGTVWDVETIAKNNPDGSWSCWSVYDTKNVKYFNSWDKLLENFNLRSSL